MCHNVYLVGFMGTGKSEVGRRVADSLGRTFIEMDAEIEREERRPIADIFAVEGEPYFRKREGELLQKIARQNGVVVSCGGGVVIDPRNLDIMHSSGICVCLKADPEAILDRVRGTTHRPLLQVPEPLKKIRALLKEREPFYSKADTCIDTTRKTLEEVVAAVTSYIQEKERTL